MIKEYNIRLNIASDIENVLHASDAGSKILWELKRNHFEASRITLWDGYAHPVLNCVLHCYDKRWLKSNKDRDLLQILQKRKSRP